MTHLSDSFRERAETGSEEYFVRRKHQQLRGIYAIALTQDSEVSEHGKMRIENRDRARRAVWGIVTTFGFTSADQFERALEFEWNWLIAKQQEKS